MSCHASEPTAAQGGSASTGEEIEGHVALLRKCRYAILISKPYDVPSSPPLDLAGSDAAMQEQQRARQRWWPSDGGRPGQGGGLGKQRRQEKKRTSFLLWIAYPYISVVRLGSGRVRVHDKGMARVEAAPADRRRCSANVGRARQEKRGGGGRRGRRHW